MAEVREFSQEMHKEAKSFIKGIKKRMKLQKAHKELMKPILDKHGVKYAWDVPQEYWRSYEWISSQTCKECDVLNGKVIRLNRKLEKIKYSYWGIHPKGEEFYSIDQRIY